jgi:hypothetical protein
MLLVFFVMNCFEKKNGKKERRITANCAWAKHQKESGIKDRPVRVECVYAEPFGAAVHAIFAFRFCPLVFTETGLYLKDGRLFIES